MEYSFDTREQASVAAAGRIAAALQKALATDKSASLVVSGGTTPTRCFRELSHLAIDWQRVTILPSDDRWVPAGHLDSNEKLIRETLLKSECARAGLLPFYAPDVSVEQRARQLDGEIRALPLPFACTLLGMGTDGHFASLFPDADNLVEGLDLDSDILCLPVTTAASPHARISLTLAALARSTEIVLLFFGNEKRTIFEKARGGNGRYPLTRLLRQKLAPVHIYWAP